LTALDSQAKGVTGPSTIRVLHLTTAHPPNDVRIYEKECKSLASEGYELTIAAQGRPNAVLPPILVRGLPIAANRRQRFTRTWLEACKLAWTGNYRIYHLHDPETIPIGLLMKLRRRTVILDVHEDLPDDIRTKNWIPRQLRPAVAAAAVLLMRAAGLVFDGIVVATPAIGRRFPRHKITLVQNFPHLAEAGAQARMPHSSRPRRVVYIGSIQAIRGTEQVVRALGLLPDVQSLTLTMAGDFETEKFHRTLAGLAGWKRVEFLGWVPRAAALGLMAQARAGIVTFLGAPNHLQAQPNKLFEYMAAGIPVIASDFPLWRRLVERFRCGILVDPSDPVAIAEALLWIVNNPGIAAEMGAHGREAVLAGLNWEHESESLTGLYRKLVR